MDMNQQVVGMKRCTFTCSSPDMDLNRTFTPTCSQQIVLNDEEDLLTLILLRVPYKQLLSLKSVSKKWHSLITSPHFTSLLHNLLPPLRASALFIQRNYFSITSGPSDQVYFLPLDDPNTTSPFRNLDFAHDPYDPHQIRILYSCNGLLLCSSSRFFMFSGSNCYVYNPSTHHLDTLPLQPLCYGCSTEYIGFAYDPSKSPHYKVIALVITIPRTSVGDLHIYSSETGTWKPSLQSFTPPSDIYFKRGVYWNRCMHWLCVLGRNSSHLPDSSVSDCLYFNVDEESFGTFTRPPIAAKDVLMNSWYFGVSQDHLHVTEVCPFATSLAVYEMKTDYSAWFLKYRIDLDPIAKAFPEMTKDTSLSCVKLDYTVAVLSLIRREDFREDSFLVLEIPGKVIRYNLVDRSFKLIWDFRVTFNIKTIARWALGYLTALPYDESVFCA